jgi:dolichyl-diphosphooligosaccharide--protein glycosyltransferase
MSEEQINTDSRGEKGPDSSAGAKPGAEADVVAGPGAKPEANVKSEAGVRAEAGFEAKAELGAKPDAGLAGLGVKAGGLKAPKLDLVERVKKVDKRFLFFLLLLFVLAFGTRAHLFKYEYLFGFDSYYHARMTGTLIETGFVPESDPLSYYFMEEGVAPPRNQFLWHFSAAIYNIATLGQGYDRELWITFVKWLPALFGALTAVGMFFLGKEMYGRKAGYVMALVAAIIPSYVYRTLAGFFEEDSLGFLWFVLGMVFFARAVKVPVFNRKGIINAVLAGLFFGIMAITWEMFLLVPLVLGLYFVFAMMHIYTKMGLGKIVDFVKLFAVSFGLFAVIASINYSPSWINRAVNYATSSVSKAAVSLGMPEGLGVTAMALILVAFVGFVVYLAYTNRSEEKRESGAKTINLIAMILLYLALISLAITFLTIPNLFEESSVLGRTVGEENTGNQFFGVKYNALIIFPVLAMLLIPIRLFRDKKDHLSTMIFFWILITFFMAWYKLKFTYTFGLPIAAAGGLIAAEMFYYLRERTNLEQKAIVLSLGFMLLVGIASATIFVPDKVPHIEVNYPAWKPALEWMRNPENVAEDAKMFNWWDEGHWISFLGERAVSADNRNMSFESNRDFSLFMVTSDLNEALRIAKEYDFDYVVMGSDMFQKVGSFGYYAYNTMNSQDERIINFLIAPHSAMPCGKEGSDYVCGGNRFNEQVMASIPAKWTSQSNQMFEQNGLTVPLYIYRDEANLELYIVNPAVNESMLGRLWFKEDEAMKYFEEAYTGFGMRLFKVKKEALPS